MSKSIESLYEFIPKEELENVLGLQKNGTGLQKNEAITNITQKWENPIPFEKKTLPSFPINVYPEWLQSFVYHLAESTQTPVDVAAVGAISILSTALSKKFYVFITDEWREPINTYCILALPPGNRKSAVFKALQEPIAEFEKEERERMEPLVIEQKAEQKAKRKRLESLEKEYAKNGDDTTLNEIKALNLEIEQEEKLNMPRFITGDVTAEKLGELMAENGEKISLLSAEGGGVFGNMAGRYSSNGQANIEIYLNGHTGDYTPIDRIGRGTLILNSPCLTIGLFIQPEVIKDVPPAFSERGLMQRFLYSFPHSLVGFRNSTPDPIPEDVKRRYVSYIKRMMKFDTSEPIKLTLDESATASRIDLMNKLEMEFRDGGRLAEMKEWGSKLAGTIIRIAGLLHVAENVLNMQEIPEQISGDTFSKARKLTDYFIEHAKEAYGVMDSIEDDKDAKYILEKITEKFAQEEFAHQSLWQLVKRKYKKVENLDKIIFQLEDMNYLRIKFDGRKKVIELNPLFLESLKTTPNTPNSQ